MAADAPRPKVALVTGASAHGEAIARTLREAGWSVQDDGALDVTDADAVRQAHARTRESHGPVSLLVCAPADEHDDQAPVARIGVERFRRAIDVHLRGVQNACRAVLPDMLEAGSGNIVAVVPADAVTGERACDECAGAGAVLGLVRALSREVGPQGVHVNAVAAGALADAPGVGRTPIGRPLSMEEVGGTVRWLAEEPHFFAGTVLSPAGGALL